MKDSISNIYGNISPPNDSTFFSKDFNQTDVKRNYDLGKDVSTYYFHNSLDASSLYKELNFYNGVKFNSEKFSLDARFVQHNTSNEVKIESKESIFSASFFYTDWVLLLIVLGFSLVAFLKYYYKKILENSFISVFSFNYSVSFSYEKKKNKIHAFPLLNFLYFTTASLFICQIAKLYEQNYISDNVFMFFIIFSFLFYMIQILYKFLNKIFGWVFNKKQLSDEYNNNITIFNNVLGLILLPIVTLMAFLNYNFLSFVVYMTGGIFLFLYLLKIYRLFEINSKKHVNILYLFLYLCGLEILPLLLIVKFLSVSVISI